jgi:hypothetical protein
LGQLREALDVLGRASLTVEGIVDDDINGLAHPILLISCKRRRGDKTGDYSYYTAKFHPLAVRAILAGAWQPKSCLSTAANPRQDSDGGFIFFSDGPAALLAVRKFLAFVRLWDIATRYRLRRWNFYILTDLGDQSLLVDAHRQLV